MPFKKLNDSELAINKIVAPGQEPIYFFPDVTRNSIGIQHLAGQLYKLYKESEHNNPPIYLWHDPIVNSGEYDSYWDERTPYKNRSLSAYAAEIVQEMLKNFSEGPYRLVGYSFGGSLAIEIARQLKAIHQKEVYLCIIDQPSFTISQEYFVSHNIDATKDIIAILNFSTVLGFRSATEKNIKYTVPSFTVTDDFHFTAEKKLENISNLSIPKQIDFVKYNLLSQIKDNNDIPLYNLLEQSLNATIESMDMILTYPLENHASLDKLLVITATQTESKYHTNIADSWKNHASTIEEIPFNNNTTHLSFIEIKEKKLGETVANSIADYFEKNLNLENFLRKIIFTTMAKYPFADYSSIFKKIMGDTTNEKIASDTSCLEFKTATGHSKPLLKLELDIDSSQITPPVVIEEAMKADNLLHSSLFKKPPEEVSLKRSRSNSGFFKPKSFTNDLLNTSFENDERTNKKQKTY